MKNQATTTQKADTRKTTSLIKKYLKEKYNIKAKVKSEKYSGGSSIRISYVAGVDTSIIDADLAGLQMGSFNGMEDIYEYNSIEAPVIDGYELQQYKYSFVEREIPETMKVKMCELISAKMNFVGVHKFDGDLHRRFEQTFGSAWSWSDLLFREVDELNFICDDVENIELISVESNPQGASFGLIFTYKYDGKEYKTVTEETETVTEETTERKKGEPLGYENYETFSPAHRENETFYQYDFRAYDGELFSCVKPTLEECRIKRDEWLNTKQNSDNNKNTVEMKKQEFKEGQTVKVTYQKGTTYTGIVKTVKEKSLMIDVDGTNKLAMLSTANVEILKDTKTPATDKKKADTSKKADAKGKTTTETKKASKTAPKEEPKPKTEDKAKVESGKPEKMTAFYKYMIELSKSINIEAKSMEAAKTVVLTPAGGKKLTQLKKDYKSGKVDVKELFNSLKDLAKNHNKTAKAKEKTEGKNTPEVHPVIDMISKVDTEQKYNQLLKVVKDQKVKFVSKKRGFEMELVKYENGNIYVKNVENDKLYYSLPSRFSVHFKVQE